MIRLLKKRDEHRLARIFGDVLDGHSYGINWNQYSAWVNAAHTQKLLLQRQNQDAIAVRWPGFGKIKGIKGSRKRVTPNLFSS